MKRKISMKILVVFVITMVSTINFLFAQQKNPVIPEAFPNFRVEGHEELTKTVRELLWHHYAGAGPKSTFWDAWLATPALWPDTELSDGFRQQWKSALSNRRIDEDGYVSSHQHDGFGHAEGWPFPLYSQGGIGWTFSRIHGAFYDEVYGIHLTQSTDGFEKVGFAEEGFTHEHGLTLQMTETSASFTTPKFEHDITLIPLVRLDWEVHGLAPNADAFLQWMCEGETDFPADRRFVVPLPKNGESKYTHLWVHKHPQWKGKITRLRLVVNSLEKGKIALRSLIVTFDSRHVVNQTTFLLGCVDYVNWTADTEFLRENIERMRHALRYNFTEFEIEKYHCVHVPWVGHDGRSGSKRNPDGTRLIRPGVGVGGNYWDIMPFGGRECLATIYLYAALEKMADLEDAIAAHPEWNVSANTGRYTSKFLREQAKKLKQANGMFWNEKAGRFVAAIDSEGVQHDYGYTFVNNEAIYYGYANEEQGKTILSWLNGDRIVEGDTSQGKDIYHWRFGPRSTTLRNLDYYFWGWAAPESIPFGDQVQDGGAVLGFAFHDLMARIKVLGPDNALEHLQENAKWFREVQQAGGYREYYAPEHKRGTMQGGNIPGGLGLDLEFFESVLYPQVMLFGFAGFEPTADGFRVTPQLPKSWPSLEIDRIRWQDQHITLKVTSGSVELTFDGPPRTIQIGLPEGQWLSEPRITLDENGFTSWKTVPKQAVRFWSL